MSESLIDFHGCHNQDEAETTFALRPEMRVFIRPRKEAGEALSAGYLGLMLINEVLISGAFVDLEGEADDGDDAVGHLSFDGLMNLFHVLLEQRRIFLVAECQPRQGDNFGFIF